MGDGFTVPISYGQEVGHASGRRLAAVKRSELAARNRFGDPSCRLQLAIQDSQSNDIHILFEW